VDDIPWGHLLSTSVMDGLTALRHIREEEAAGSLSLNLVIALSKSTCVQPAHACWTDFVKLEMLGRDRLTRLRKPVWMRVSCSTVACYTADIRHLQW
jgi:CheY-like chemotaxis protein